MNKQGADLLTVVEMVHHRPVDGPGCTVDSRYSRQLETQEQLYQRRLDIGADWQRLDLGWLKDTGISAMVLVNREGRNLTANPTEEEQESINSRIVEVAYSTDEDPNPEPSIGSWLVLPGESFRGSPSKPELLIIRCLSESAKCLLTLIPR